MNLAAAKAVFEILRAAYKRDRSNSYALERDYAFWIKTITPAYDGRLWRFVPQPEAGGTSVVLKGYGAGVNDGATLAPDAPARNGAALHAPGYIELEDIAAAWERYG